MIREDYFPLSRTDDIFDILSGVNRLSTLNLKSGYILASRPASRRQREDRFFFIVHWLWQFAANPSGFCNVPATFELLMEAVLRGLTYEPSLVYLDHAFLGQTFQEQLEHLLTVFQRFGGAHLTLNSEKCQLFQKEPQLQC